MCNDSADRASREADGCWAVAAGAHKAGGRGMERPATEAALLSYQTHNRALDDIAIAAVVNVRQPKHTDGNGCRDKFIHLEPPLLKYRRQC